MNIADSIKELVRARARQSCEYCHLPSDASYVNFHIDHIIPLKHDGSSDMDNLAYCCRLGNQYKGYSISAFIPGTRQLISLFDPRNESWKDHFAVNSSGFLMPKSATGEATIRVLKMNISDRVQERLLLIELGLF